MAQHASSPLTAHTPRRFPDWGRLARRGKRTVRRVGAPLLRVLAALLLALSSLPLSVLVPPGTFLAPQQAAAVGATVTLNPTSGPPGTVVTVTGSGWFANWPDGVMGFGGTDMGLFSTDASGNIVANTTFTVPADATPGAKTVLLGQDLLILQYSGEATFTVTGPVTRYVASPGGTDTTNDCKAQATPCATITHAITQASAGDTVQVAAGTYVENLTIDKNLTLTGAGARDTTLDGDGSDAVVIVNAGVTADISGFTITNGGSFGNGGGIENNGTLTLRDSAVTNSVALGAGGIYSHSGTTLTVLNSTISGNEGGDGYAGGISNLGALTVVNSTISGNSAASGGGGIASYDGTVTIIHSTIIKNTVDDSSAGGLNEADGTFTVRGSIIAGNTSGPAGSKVTTNCAGTITSGGHNLSDDATCFATPGTGDQQNVADPKVDVTLKNNGGPTDTHALLSGSPAIDGGPATCKAADSTTDLTTDQRGETRPVGAKCDIGAYEVQTVTPATRYVDDTGDDELGDNDCKTQGNPCATIAHAISKASAGDTILATPGTYNERITIDKNLTLTTDGNPNATLDGQEGGTVVTVNSGVTATISRFIITKGKNTTGNGGGILNQGTLTVAQSTISGNTTTGNGGGISSTGTLTIENSTISGNTASVAGGGGQIAGGTATVINSTISGNTSNASGFGVNAAGGLLVTATGTLQLIHSTVISNRAPNTSTGGGGLTGSSGALKVRGSIVAHNTMFNGFLKNCSTTVTTQGYNLSNDTSCGFTGTGDQQGLLTDPKVDLNLKENGGPTQTHGLAAGSPALDKVPPADCKAADDTTDLTTDQRGEARPTSGANCDIGAFEGSLTPATRYVDDTGGSNTANDCKTQGSPCATIAHAITQASTGDTVQVAAGTYQERIIIDRSLTLTGAGAAAATLDGQEGGTVIKVNRSVTATISGLTITKGKSNFGGGIWNEGLLTVLNSAIHHNMGNNGAGGLYNSAGIMTVQSSTISNNTANSGGGIMNYGSTPADGKMIVQNSTISGNTATNGAGGISNFAGTLTVVHSTVVLNGAGSGGGGIEHGSSGSVTVRGSIVALNTGASAALVNCSGTIGSGGYNLSNDSTCAFTGTGDQQGTSVDPKVDTELKNNGGPTQTHALLTGSPALDAVPAASCKDADGTTPLTTDQRGETRPTDSDDADTTADCDIGAYEFFVPPTRYVDDTGGSDSANDCLIEGSPCATVAHAIGQADAGDVVQVAAGTYPERITINKNLTFRGAGASTTTLDGQEGGTVVTVTTGVTASISGFTITKGKTAASGGGILNQGTLTVQQSTISGNTATSPGAGSGGGIHNTGTLTVQGSSITGNTAGAPFTAYYGGGIGNTGTLTVQNSTISGNTASYSGGGVYNDGGVLTIRNSTLHDNDGATQGGGIYAEGGTVTVTGSTISGNRAPDGGYGGGINQGFGSLTLANSTISGNTAAGNGGGVYVNGATTKIIHSTIVDNASASGGGIYWWASGTLNVRGSIVARNTKTGDMVENCVGTITSQGYNLSDDSTCSFTGTGDQQGVADPKVDAELKDHGGPTQTHALLPGSPALDAVPAASCKDADGTTALTKDQRGETRPADGLDADTIADCDMGAFEGFLPPLALTVNSVFDVVESNIGDGTCDTGRSGPPVVTTPECTLRAAIQEANASPSGAIITLPAGVYTLTIAGPDDAAATGDLDLTNLVTISGAAAATTIIQGCDFDADNTCTGIDRIFQALPGGGLTLSQVTVRKGDAAGNIGSDTAHALVVSDSVITATEGFGIDTLGSGGVTLTNSTISHVGSGINHYSTGAVTLTNSTISDTNGDGIANLGAVTLTDSTINNVLLNGIFSVGDGAVTLTNSTISNTNGSGIWFGNGPVAVTDSIINNTGNGINGPGSNGAVTVTNSTISNGNGYGIWVASSPVTVTNSTISNNNGNGITNGPGAEFLMVTNSTISGNTIIGIESNIFTGVATVTNSTIINNLAGISDGAGTLSVKASIVAHNSAGNCLSTLPVSAGYNLSNDTGCGFTSTGDQQDVADLKLDPELKDNGGPTKTHALIKGSPALDKIPAASCTDQQTPTPQALTTDQRGEPRPVDGPDADTTAACDVGAYEGFVLATLNLTVNSTADMVDSNIGDGVCYAGPVGSLRVPNIADQLASAIRALGADLECTLRAAIQEANAFDGKTVITLPAGAYTLTIPGTDENAAANKDLDITKTVTITGEGAATTIIQGCDFAANANCAAIDRIFDVQSASTLNVSGVTLRKGFAGSTISISHSTSALTLTDSVISNGGVALLQNNGSVTVTNSVITQNFNVGISKANGTLTLTNSTISNNINVGINNVAGTATIRNSAIFGNVASGAAGGIQSGGTLTVVNSTISNNATTATSTNGGIAVTGGTATIIHSTIVNNRAPNFPSASGGGGLRQTGTANVTVRGSIVAYNSVQGSAVKNCSGSITSGGYNLAEDDTCAFTGTGDQQGTTASPLDVKVLRQTLPFGGLTPSNPLLAGSPALDAVPAANCTDADGTTALATDQRGEDRSDGNCDKGAYEGFITPVDLTVTRQDDPAPDGCQVDDCSLREAVLAANAAGSATITLPAGAHTLSIAGINEDAAATGDLDLIGTVTITGTGAADTIIQGCDVAANANCTGIDRIFHLMPNAFVSVSGVTVRKGSGGIVFTGYPTALHVTDSVFTSNFFPIGATQGVFMVTNTIFKENTGTVILNAGSAMITVHNSAITDNAGVGISTSSGTITVVNSTISRNASSSTSGAAGVSATGGTTTIIHSTIVGNRAPNANAGSGSGGVFQSSSGTLNLRGSIVAYNTAKAGTNQNCGGTITSQGYNLGEDDTCAFTGTGDQQGTVASPLDVKLLRQAVHRGAATPAHPLLEGSPALDAVPVADCTDHLGQPLLTDQQDHARQTAAEACDKGAYEGFITPEILDVTREDDPAPDGCQVDDCSLREAVLAANVAGYALINVSQGQYTLSITGQNEDAAATGDLDLIGTATIQGTGAADTFIQACNVAANAACTGIDRVLQIRPGAWITLTGATVRKGSANGILVDAGGTLAVQESVITTNAVSGILANGFLTVTHSVISSNIGTGLVVSSGSTVAVTHSTIASNTAVGINNSGGAATVRHSAIAGNSNVGIINSNTAATTTVVNSTISGNSNLNLTSGGGGIQVTNGTVTVIHSTIVGNSAPNASSGGGGVFQSGGTVNVRGSLVANNTAKVGTNPNCAGSITSQGYNLSNDSTCAFTGTGDQQGTSVDPKLDTALADHGGPTQTYALITGSPALDAVPPASCLDADGTTALMQDQRGTARPKDGNTPDPTANCDIGAFEGFITPVTIEFSAETYSELEQDDEIIVTVTRTGDLFGTVSVKYATSDGTATDGEDYTAQSGTLTFEPLQTARTIIIPITDDGDIEVDETITVTLSDPVDAVVGETATATATITNDDVAGPAATQRLTLVGSKNTALGARGLPLARPLEVQATTLAGAAVADKSVEWVVRKVPTDATGASFAETTTTTSFHGLTAGHFTFGEVNGVYKVRGRTDLNGDGDAEDFGEFVKFFVTAHDAVVRLDPFAKRAQLNGAPADVAVVLDTAVYVDGAAFRLTYDATALEVLDGDSNPDNGVQLLPDSTITTVITNLVTVSGGAGTINFTGYLNEGLPQGTRTLATLRLRGLTQGHHDLSFVAEWTEYIDGDNSEALVGDDGVVDVRPVLLHFEAQPVRGAAGLALGVQPAVTLRDHTGALWAEDSMTVVTLGLLTGNGAALQCSQTSGGTTSLLVTNGLAEFSGCKVDLPGADYKLEASAPTATARQSDAFNITLAGDVNNDCRVSITDFSKVVTHFGKSNLHADWANPTRKAYEADINGDQRISVVDFSLVVSRYGSTGPACAVPSNGVAFPPVAPVTD